MIQKTASGPGLLLCVPTLGRPVTLAWAMNFKSLHCPINFNMNVLTVYGKPIAEARNEAAKMAKEQGHKYLFFLGDDVIPYPNMIRQFVFRMEHDDNLGVVGGVYCSKSEPAAPLVFKENGRGSYWKWRAGEYFECSGLGMDATLIRTDIFNHISEPYFKTVDEDKFDDGENSADQWTEDLYFCKKVVDETSFSIFCDASILLAHVDVYSDKAYTLPIDSYPVMQVSTEEKKGKALDIGCGPINRASEFPEHQLVRVDIREEVNPDYRCDVRSLPFKDKEFDIVFSSHVLEHFPRNETSKVLKEWTRVLKEDGKLVLVLPNIQWALKNFDSAPTEDVYNVLYGAQSNPFDFHQNGLHPAFMHELLLHCGMKDIEIQEDDYNMIIHAQFRKSTQGKSKDIKLDGSESI